MGGSHESSVKDTVGPVACTACDLFEVCALIDALPVSSGLRRRPTLRPLARGEVLYEAGTPALYLHALRKGVVKSEAAGSGGAKRVDALHIPGDAMDRESVAKGLHTRRAVAATSAMVCELPLEPYLGANPQLESLRAGIQRLGTSSRERAVMRGGFRERLESFIAQLKARLQSRAIETDFALELRKGDLAGLLRVRSLGKAAGRTVPKDLVQLRGQRVLLQKSVWELDRFKSG